MLVTLNLNLNFVNTIYMESNTVFHFIPVLINLLVCWIIFTLIYLVQLMFLRCRILDIMFLL